MLLSLWLSPWGKLIDLEVVVPSVPLLSLKGIHLAVFTAQGCVAFRAVTAQADGAAEQIAVWAASLADEPFAAALAFVNGLRHHCAAALEFLTQALQVG